MKLLYVVLQAFKDGLARWWLYEVIYC